MCEKDAVCFPFLHKQLKMISGDSTADPIFMNCRASFPSVKLPRYLYNLNNIIIFLDRFLESVYVFEDVVFTAGASFTFVIIWRIFWFPISIGKVYVT